MAGIVLYQNGAMKLIQSREDKLRALDILVKAFCESPGMVWMLPGQRSTNKKFRKLIALCYHEAEAKNGAFITSDKNGVVLYFRLQNRNVTIQNILRKLYVLFFVTGLKNGLRAMRYRKIVDDIRPKIGWLGWLVATDSDASGNAAAYEIKNEMFRLADETNEPVFVETTVPRVRVLYRAAGYHEYAQLKHPYRDLTVWFMRRDPNPIKLKNN